MKSSVSLGIQRAINKQTTFCVLFMIILIPTSSVDTLIRLSSSDSLQTPDYHTDFIQNALCSSTLESFIPILAVLPYTTSYIDDVKSKFSRSILIRTNYTTYLMSHILLSFLSGGLVIVAGILLAWGLSALLFLPIEQIAESPSDSAAVLLKTCWLLFMTSGFWSVMGLTMSTIMESKYIAYASPFIVYYLLVILCERYFPDAWLLYPKNWLVPEIWPYGIGSATLFFLELTFLCGLVFYIRGRRRLENL